MSAAQKLYQKDRFRVQPGSIDSYGLGKGALAEAERKKVGHKGRIRNKKTGLFNNLGAGNAKLSGLSGRLEVLEQRVTSVRSRAGALVVEVRFLPTFFSSCTRKHTLLDTGVWSTLKGFFGGKVRAFSGIFLKAIVREKRALHRVFCFIYYIKTLDPSGQLGPRLRHNEILLQPLLQPAQQLQVRSEHDHVRGQERLCYSFL